MDYNSEISSSVSTLTVPTLTGVLQFNYGTNPPDLVERTPHGPSHCHMNPHTAFTSGSIPRLLTFLADWLQILGFPQQVQQFARIRQELKKVLFL